MRYVAIALVLFSFPIFLALLRQYPHRRGLAFVAIGVMMFCGDRLRIDAAIVAWPMWKGIAGGIGISPIDMLALALIATRTRRGGALPFRGVLGLYFLTLVLSIVESSVPLATMFVWWFWLRLLILFVAITGECDRPEMRGHLLNGLSLGLMLQASYVIPQKLSGVVQATGAMYHQNALGMMTEQALLVITGAVLSGERGWIMKAGVVAGLIVVVGGGSRAAMVMTGCGMVVLTLFSLWRRRTPAKLRMVGLGALALVVITPLGVLTMKERFGSNSVITEETERASFERAARAMANDHPFGVGASLYVTTANLGGYADRAGVAWNYANRSAPVHNAYLLARAETGWLGQFAYMLVILVPLITGLRFAFKHRAGAGGDIALGSCAALGVLAIHNMYEFAGLTYPILMLTIANISIIAGIVRVRSPRRGAASRTRPTGTDGPPPKRLVPGQRRPALLRTDVAGQRS